MAMFRPALTRVKQELQQLLPASLIAQIAREAGHVGRLRRLPPAVSVHLLVLQLLAQSALTGLRHLQELEVTASAICQARSKMPLTLMYRLIEQMAAAIGVRLAGQDDSGRFCGLEVMLADATSVQCQDTPELAKRYKNRRNQHRGNQGYPGLKVLCLMHYATGMITRVIDLPWYRQEHMVLRRLVKELHPGRVVVGDRGLTSFGFLARVLAQGAHACLRLSTRDQARRGDLRRVHRTLQRSRNLVDQLVIWRKSPRRATSVSKAAYEALPETLLLRQIRYRVDRRGFRCRWICVITTLEEAYAGEEIAKLYGRRWQIEVYFRDLKQSQGLMRLRAKTREGMKKELLAHVLVYNLVRKVMLEAAVRQHVEPSRISFRDALRYLLHAQSDKPLPILLVNPRRLRPGEPRRVKDLKLKYPYLRKPRRSYRLKDVNLT